MSDNDEKLKKLLQLKNYETPGQEYFDGFLDDFKQQQKRESARLTKTELVKEKVGMWLDELGPAKWAVPAGSMAALALTFLVLGNREQPIVESTPKVDQSDQSKSEPKVMELQLPKPTPSSAGPASKAAAKPDGMVPVQF